MRKRSRRQRTPWLRIALIAAILYVAGILVPLAAWVFAVQRHWVQSAWSTGNILLLALALAGAAALGLFGWIVRVARRV